jgi:hypothetical protein
MFKKWSGFRRRQREILRASNAPTPIAQNGEADPDEALQRDHMTGHPATRKGP